MENQNNKYIKMVVETNAGVDTLSYNEETQEVRYFNNGGSDVDSVTLWDFIGGYEKDEERAAEWLKKYFDDDSAGELYEDVEDVYNWLGVDGRNVKVLAEIEW